VNPNVRLGRRVSVEPFVYADRMEAILSPAGQPVLFHIARHRPLLAFDFDGTLAPIVEDRGDAELRPRTRALLRTAALLYPCAVVSGRARADVAARVDDIPLVAIVGNHGAEPGFGPVDAYLRLRVEGWISVLREALGGARGVELEDKRLGVALHHRAAPSWSAARRRILAAVAALPGAHVTLGRAVVNLTPDDAPTKADAVAEVVRRVGANGAVYVGDDHSDEDAFRSGLLDIAIRIGRTARSAAPWYVPTQEDVDALLAAFVTARLHLDGRGDRTDALVRAIGP
jgi:trehalose 6-phosphate phosphatase